MKTTAKNAAITISVRDMLLYICSHWRSLLIAALAGCILLTGYGLLKNTSSEPENHDLQKAAETAMSNMNGLDRAKTLQMSGEALNYLNRYTYYVDYIKNSKFQNLDASRILKTTLTYQIDAPENEITPVVMAFESGILGNALKEKLMKEKNIEEQEAFYLLDKCITTPNKPLTENGKGNDVMEYSCLQILVYDDDPESLKEITEYVKETVTGELYQEISKNSSFKISLRSENTADCIDYYVTFYQNDLFNKAKETLDKIEEIKAKMSGNQRNVIRYELYKSYQGDYIGIFFSDMENMTVQESKADEGSASTTSRGGLDSSEVEVQKSSGFSPDKKKMVIGFLGGFLLMAVLWMLYYMFFGILHVKEDISCIFDLPVIGTFTTKKKFRNLRFDKWIWSLRTGRKEKTTDEELSEISGRLQMFAETSGVAKVALILNEENENLKDLLKDLKCSLEIQILDSVTDVVKIQEVQAVVLLAKSDASKILKIQSDLSFFDGTDRKILGLILAE